MKSNTCVFERPLLAAVFLGLAPALAGAQALNPTAPADLPADTVVATRGAASITLAEIDAKVRTMPPELRAGYLTDPQRIGRMLDAMMLSEQMAAEAEQAGVGNDPQLRDDLALLRSEMMANRYISQHMKGLKEPNFELLAKERYLAKPEAFKPKARIDLRHILISTDGHDEQWAKSLAQSIRDRVNAGEKFEQVIEAVRSEHGDAVRSDQIPNADLNRLDPKFAASLLEIQKVGDYAGPVRSRFGYHVIKLENRIEAPIPPFEEIKEQLIGELRNEFQVAERNRFLAARSQIEFELNSEAINTLPTRYAGAVKEAEGAAFAFGQSQAAAAQPAAPAASPTPAQEPAK